MKLSVDGDCLNREYRVLEIFKPQMYMSVTLALHSIAVEIVMRAAAEVMSDVEELVPL